MLDVKQMHINKLSGDREMKTLIAAAATAAMFAGNAYADDLGIGVRLRGLAVIPAEDATVTPLGQGVEIDNAFVPEIDFTYYFNDNIAVELIAATAKHEVAAEAGPTDLGSVWLLPPTLTLQYHFTQFKDWTGVDAKPYLGAGVNYTFFLAVSDPDGLAVDYEDGFGGAIQAGVDIPMKDNWYFNIDVKKIFLSTDVSINNAAITADVDIDPLIIGAGIGIRF